MVGQISVEKMRLGLFRINWQFREVENHFLNVYQESFTLFGSYSNRSYIISHIFKSKQCLDNPVKFSVFSLEEVPCNSTLVNVRDTVDDNSLFQHQQQSNSNEHQKGEGSSFLLKTPEPFKIWLDSEDVTFTSFSSLVKASPGKWKVSQSYQYQPTGITLFIDFGTQEVVEKKILNGLAEMFHSQHLCDIYFQFKEDQQTIGAHAVVVSTGSPVFAAMFPYYCLNSQLTRKIQINDIDHQVFKQLLIFLYSGSAPEMTKKNITRSLYEAASRYGVETLKDECLKVLANQLSTENALEILIWSQLHSIPKLFEDALQVVAKNSLTLCSQPDWLDFIKSYPDLCLMVNQRMACLLPFSDSEEDSDYQ
jgi:speckle-type POZ protein